jgi:hypothetical protein
VPRGARRRCRSILGNFDSSEKEVKRKTFALSQVYSF